MYPHVGTNHHWQKNEVSLQLILTMPIMKVGWHQEEVVVLAEAKAEEEVLPLLVVVIITVMGKEPSIEEGVEAVEGFEVIVEVEEGTTLITQRRR